MPEYSTGVPVVVINQETQPIASDYKFWIKTSTSEIFYSDGLNWTELPSTTPEYVSAVLENALNILEIQAADTITPDTSATIVRDIFSDSTGYLNTIDTTNTTAQFNTDKYLNNKEDTEEITAQVTTSTNTTAKTGAKFDCDTSCKLISITKGSNVTGATKAYLLNSSKAEIANATFSGDIATFATPQSLTASTTYYIAVDDAGGSYTSRFENPGGFPIARDYLTFSAGLDNVGNDSAANWSILNCVVREEQTNAVIQTAAQSLPSTPEYFQVFSFRDATAGTGSINCDISFDNGSNYQTGVSLNTTTEIINQGSEMILKLNLNGEGSGNTSECEGFGVLFW